MDEVELTTFQVEVAHAFFELKASEGYVVAGGAALIASELISRPTQVWTCSHRLLSCRSLRPKSRSSKRSAAGAGLSP